VAGVARFKSSGIGVVPWVNTPSMELPSALNFPS
jgi:hypothetical protein